MVYEIKTYGEDCLYKKNEIITEINEEVLKFLDDMVDTMHEVNGVGLAAPQIGVNKRAFVLDINDGKIRKVINPEIISYGEECGDAEEGCLSVPGIYKKVKRPETIKVKYQTEKNEMIEEEISGFLARAFQHEYDHLEGVLFVEKISPVSKKMIAKKLQLMKKEVEKKNKNI